MNNALAAARDLVRGLLEQADDISEVDKVIAPPFTALLSIKEILRGSSIKLAAQNIHYEEKGAFTGEIAPAMLEEIGCDYVIIGHSERRAYYNETNETVNKKIFSALKHGIIPIVCVGETENEWERGVTREVITNQVAGCFADLSKEEVAKMIIAYEPIWAIGTGKTATPEQAQEVHTQIRELIARGFGSEAASLVRIQYGGSVKPENTAALLSQPDIDGALVGGASLQIDSFVEIIRETARLTV